MTPLKNWVIAEHIILDENVLNCLQLNPIDIVQSWTFQDWFFSQHSGRGHTSYWRGHGFDLCLLMCFFIFFLSCSSTFAECQLTQGGAAPPKNDVKITKLITCCAAWKGNYFKGLNSEDFLIMDSKLMRNT